MHSKCYCGMVWWWGVEDVEKDLGTYVCLLVCEGVLRAVHNTHAMRTQTHESNFCEISEYAEHHPHNILLLFHSPHLILPRCHKVTYFKMVWSSSSPSWTLKSSYCCGLISPSVQRITTTRKHATPIPTFSRSFLWTGSKKGISLSSTLLFISSFLHCSDSSLFFVSPFYSLCNFLLLNPLFPFSHNEDLGD